MPVVVPPVGAGFGFGQGAGRFRDEVFGLNVPFVAVRCPGSVLISIVSFIVTQTPGQRQAVREFFMFCLHAGAQALEPFALHSVFTGAGRDKQALALFDRQALAGRSLGQGAHAFQHQQGGEGGFIADVLEIPFLFFRKKTHKVH